MISDKWLEDDFWKKTNCKKKNGVKFLYLRFCLRENGVWRFFKYLCIKTSFNEIYSKLENEALNEKILFYIFFLFSLLWGICRILLYPV